ncbi:uncharacterized protein A1O5_10755 [Cladophialophora psammophila CBS 110553]|uniref:Uncharacterized protein n=1 Tax=Cladophialophora psammophila CBS 110553 TaxID=1182543 RepID=W9WMA7_9EURO|nr:uncharacterized protein A1O5_10755 [Cladophialophora psammophila CBS 110553]EXJ66140.1 hypothetical protein A1O5_10755 [Cladophialophora psammophila CBS 110553]
MPKPASIASLALDRDAQLIEALWEWSASSQGHPTATPTSYDELFKLIRELKSKSNATKDQIASVFFSQLHSPTKQSAGKTLRLALRLLLMVDCSTGPINALDELEAGDLQPPWQGDVTLEDFLSSRFPLGDNPIFSDDNIEGVNQSCKDLRARNLQGTAHLRFRPTDDMSRHLYLDRKTYTIEIFHHTSFLKEYLIMSKPGALGNGNRCVMPRQLALEVLDTIQKVLFPFSDSKSMRILKRLVTKSDEKGLCFQYFGERLALLLDEVENLRPHGVVERWVDRKSGARYVMLATLIGVIFAILLELTALALSAHQTWIAYQAWKHLVTPS